MVIQMGANVDRVAKGQRQGDGKRNQWSPTTTVDEEEEICLGRPDESSPGYASSLEKGVTTRYQ